MIDQPKPEVFPNITFEAESQKVMSGSEWQKGEASMIRHFESEIRLLEDGIHRGCDPIVMLQNTRQWLAQCLYQCNMENFKSQGGAS